VNDALAVANDAAGGVARIHHEFRAFNYSRIVIAGMIGGNDHGIVVPECLRVQRHGLHVREIVVTHFVQAAGSRRSL